MFDAIWGLKTEAMMDVWTIDHILNGLSIGSAMIIINHKVFKKKLGLEKHLITTKHFDIVGVCLIAYLWETIEHYLETGLVGGKVEYWFQGVEFWPNRIIFDPLMLVIGYLVAKRHPKLVNPARILSLAWLIIHIFVFPHSMYLHNIL